MGERALAACQRPSSRGKHPRGVVLDCFGSQWAGTDERVAAVLETERASADPLLECRWKYLGSCELATLPGVLDYLSHDVVYLVGPDGVGVYLPVWLGVPTAGGVASAATDGVPVRVTSLAELRSLRGRIRELKDWLGPAVEAGRLSPSEARGCLLATLVAARHYEPPATCGFDAHQLP